MPAKLRRLGRRLAISCGIAVLLQGLNGFLAFTATSSYIRAANERRESLHILDEGEEFLSLLKDAETGQRGFLLTADASYLEPYELAMERIAPALVDFRAACDGLYQSKVRKLEPLVGLKLTELHDAIEAMKSAPESNRSAILEQLKSNRGKQYMDDIRRTVAEIESEERQRLDAITLRMDKLAESTAFRVFLASSFAVVLLGLVVWQVFKEFRARLETQDQLHEKSSILQSVLDSMGDGVIVADPTGKLRTFNLAARQMHGLEPDEAPSEKWSERYGLYQLDRVTPFPATQLPMVRALRGEIVENVEMVLRNKVTDGMYMGVSGRPIRDAEGNFRGGVVVVRDITKQKNAEDALRRNHQVLESIVNSSTSIIFLKDAQGRFLQVNRQFEQLWRLPSEKVLGRSGTELFSPEVAQRFQATDDEVLASGTAIEREEVIRRDNEDHVFLQVKFPVKDAHGKVFAVGGILTDITERKRNEMAIRQMNDDLERRVQERTKDLDKSNAELLQKNQENELFVYSVSHDLRSPLVNLQGFSQELMMAGERLQELFSADGIPTEVKTEGLSVLKNDVSESVRFIQTAVHRLAGIIDALLRLSRAGRVEYQWQTVSMQTVVKRIVDSLHAALAIKKATVDLQSLPEVWGDSFALEQVFGNLVDNAIKYLSPDRAGHIEIGALPIDLKRPTTRTFFVRDNGLGLPEKGRQKLFKAFERLHPQVTGGEGVGLTITRRIVERHGGEIWVESQVDVGSTFFVLLPTCAEEVAASVNQSSSTSLK